MKIASITCNTGEFALDKKKNSIADTFGKYLNKSSYNTTHRLIKYITPILVIVLMGAQYAYATPTSVMQGGAYSRGYNDASCDTVLCNGHGYDPRCPGDHSSEYCSNYKDGYAAGWGASTNANNNSQSGSDVGGTTGTQSQSQSVAHTQELPFWLPFDLPHDMPLKYFHMELHHVTADLGLIRTCFTDINSTHGVCHYMNATEEEDQLAGKNIDADAGIFAFPPSTFPLGDTVQVCIKPIALHKERCILDINNDALTNTTKYEADMDIFRSAFIEKPKDMDLNPLAGSVIV